MRVLAVLYCYPPLLVPASICYGKLVAGLRARGVDVDVLAITPESFRSPGKMPLDPDLAAALPQDVGRLEVHSPELSLWVKVLDRLDEQRRFSYRWLEPRKREWTIPARKLVAGLDPGRYDVVFTCSQPHANHLLGPALRDHLDAPWVAYFSDPWTENAYATYVNDRVKNYHRALEREVLVQADRVMYTCPEMLEFVLANHPELDASKTGCLPHCFVPEWYPSADEDRDPVLRVLHAGNFYGPRTPDPILDSLARLSARHDLKGRIRVDSFGGVDERHLEKARSLGLGDVFFSHGFVSYLESLGEMARSDALLLVDAPLSGNTAAQSVFLPSKLIDYMGAHKPIVALTPNRGATARVVREIGGQVCPLEEPERIDEVLDGLLMRGVSASPLDAAATEAYAMDVVAGNLASEFEAVIR